MVASLASSVYTTRSHPTCIDAAALIAQLIILTIIIPVALRLNFNCNMQKDKRRGQDQLLHFNLATVTKWRRGGNKELLPKCIWSAAKPEPELITGFAVAAWSNDKSLWTKAGHRFGWYRVCDLADLAACARVGNEARILTNLVDAGHFGWAILVYSALWLFNFHRYK